MEVTLPVWKIGIQNGYLTERISTGGDTFRETKKSYHVVRGELKIVVPIHGAVVLTGK
jgi:hypothetical protein